MFLILLVIFSILKLPLKIMRHAFYYHGGCGPGYMGPGLHMWNSFFWLALFILILWLADRHSVHAHEAVEHLRSASHRVVDALRDWWNKPSPSP